MFGRTSTIRRWSRLDGWCEGCGGVPRKLIRLKVGAQVLQACDQCWSDLERLKRRLVNEDLESIEGG